MNKFLEFVADVMEVDCTELSMETAYREGKWDSFMMLTIVMELEAEYAVSIPVESLSNVKTLADLYEFVK